MPIYLIAGSGARMPQRKHAVHANFQGGLPTAGGDTTAAQLGSLLELARAGMVPAVLGLTASVVSMTVGSMATHSATIAWNRPSLDFLKGRYSRDHTWTFDGGLSVEASSAPSVVPPPLSNPAHVDPEEAYVAALASCHMLTFLHLASRQGFHVESYADTAVGEMTKNERGIPWMHVLTLRPRIIYAGERRPTPEEETRLHHMAHDHCYIANSVKTEIRVVPEPR
jgi:organic hydroperoxide reductase OsmC/OhrA